MATFNITTPYTFANGTAANDTFNIGASLVTGWGLEGDDAFVCTAHSVLSSSLDGGAGNDSFDFSFSNRSLVSGGDGHDTVFFAAGSLNVVSCGIGNDWIGIGGGALSSPERARRGRRRRFHRRGGAIHLAPGRKRQ